MKQIIGINLTKRQARDWAPPELVFGERLTIALRLYKDVEGEEIETSLHLESLKASIGLVDARPTGGQFAIKIGNDPTGPSNTTAALPHDVSASALTAALNAVAAHAAYGAARVVATDGSWLIFFGEQSAQVPLSIVRNALWPVSYGRLGAYQVDGRWVHELRLIQGPVAFTSSHDVVLPASPTITRIQAGGSDGVLEWNEIQELSVPPEFRGSYLLQRGTAKSGLLSREDGMEAIQDALQNVSSGNFKVTLPLSNRPNIEFIGELAGLPQDLLAVVVKQTPPGDVTFSLDLDRAELAACLRRAAGEAITLPLEVRLTGADADGFGGEMIACALDVTIRPPVVFPEIEEVPTLDLLRPYSPRTYVPYGAHNELIGQKYYRATVGDGTATQFVVAHGLNSDTVFVFARENASGGGQLTQGVDFAATLDNANQVTVTALGAAPAAAAWSIVVLSADPTAIWAQDLTVTVPQVIAGGGYASLPDFMDSISQRVTDLEAILPTITIGVSSASGGNVEIPIPERTEVLFHRGAEVEIKEGKLPELPRRSPYMLPAIHTATNDTSLPDPLPDPTLTTPGTLWINDSGSPVLVPVGGGIRSGWVADGAFVGCDGRALYAANRDGAAKSYYPTAFERELFAFFVSEKMLATRRMEIVFGVTAGLVGATSRASWLLEIQAGTAPQDVSPATTGPNLQDVLWNATPILRERLVLTQEFVTHTFGTRIKNALDGMVCDVQNYGLWTGNNAAAPAGPNFALRARLIAFDTENSRPDARGWVVYRLAGASSGEAAAKLAAVIA